MADRDDRVSADSSRAFRVLLFSREGNTPEDARLTRLLDFFAIPWEMARPHGGELAEPEGRYVIVSSADCIADAIRVTERNSGIPSWVRNASSAYIYGFRDDEPSTKVLRLLTGNPQARVTASHSPEMIMEITGDLPEMCGPMSGMRIPVTPALGSVFDIGRGEAFQSVIRNKEREVFFQITFSGLSFFLTTCARILDISVRSNMHFDVRKSFCEAAPFIFYLKWAFPNVFSSSETSACLIVDDPPLKRSYGFLDFGKALNLMDQHNFATTIAFIPWNWRRTNPRTLDLFRRYPRRLSLVVHGCDHTAGEFAARSPAWLNWKIRTAGQRMECFRRRASLAADNVMVFPQGRFSPEAGRALKLNGFLAAVNTEVAPAQAGVNETTIADLWSVAIMKYGTFPIFTRRYLNHGIENFAFDALLGKPCLIAAHHDVFRDQARDLVHFVDRLNSLKWNLAWRPLGEALRRSFTNRRLEDGTHAIQLFASGAVLENPGAEERKVLLLKEEADSGCVEAVRVNDTSVEFTAENGCLRTHSRISRQTTISIHIVYRNNANRTQDRYSLRSHVEIAARRYLSEFRDNYLSRSESLYRRAYRLKSLIG